MSILEIILWTVGLYWFGGLSTFAWITYYRYTSEVEYEEISGASLALVCAFWLPWFIWYGIQKLRGKL